MSKYSSEIRGIGSLLIVMTLFGSGCIPQKTALLRGSANINVSNRATKDDPIHCDIYFPAAPPCSYQITPDGMQIATIQPAPPSSTSTANVIIQKKDGTSQIVYTGQRSSGTVWYTSGISDDGKFVYVVENILHPEGGIPFIHRARLSRINTADHTRTEIKTWDGSPLDVYVHENRMILWIVDDVTKTEKLVLTDLAAETIRTLYEGGWTNIDQNNIVTVGDLSQAFSKVNDILFVKATISPDGTKAVVQGGPSPWPTYTLFDLGTTYRTDLTTIPQKNSIKGWADNDTLLLTDEVGATSTFMLSEHVK